MPRRRRRRDSFAILGSPQGEILEVNPYPGAEGAGKISIVAPSEGNYLKESLCPGAEGAGFFAFWDSRKAKSKVGAGLELVSTEILVPYSARRLELVRTTS